MQSWAGSLASEQVRSAEVDDLERRGAEDAAQLSATLGWP